MPAEALFSQQMSKDPATRWKIVPPVMEVLKAKAKKLGLWNLWLSGGEFQHLAGGAGKSLSNVEYGVLAELCAYASHTCPQAMNCAAPDTGNMEVIARFGTQAQKDKYLTPLLNGEIRSSFAMTEYGVASSDASNLHNTTVVRKGDKLILRGHKWWISGAGDPRNAVHIVVAVTDPNNPSKHKRHSLILVDPKAPGVKIVRPLTVFGYDDAPEGHCEVIYDNVELDANTAVVGGAGNLGRGFEMLQARLGPGRIHHCMRSIGVASRALDLLILRVCNPARKTFGKELREHGTILANITKSRAQIEQGRLIVLAAAKQIDMHGAKTAMKEIGIAKVVVPQLCLDVIDRAMQVHGAEGISQDQPLAMMYAHARTLRYADGPDEVHTQQVAKIELRERLDYLRDRQRRVREAEIRMGVKAQNAKL